MSTFTPDFILYHFPNLLYNLPPKANPYSLSEKEVEKPLAFPCF